MKNSSILLIALAMLVSSTTFAAPSVSNKSGVKEGGESAAQAPTASESLSDVRAKRSAKAKDAKAKRAAVVAPVKTNANQAPALNKTSSFSGSSVGTTSAPLARAVTAPKKNKFSVKFRDYTALNTQGLEGNGTAKELDQEAFAWDRLNLTYNFSDDVSFSVMPQYQHTWFGARDRQQDPGKIGLEQNYSSFLMNTGLILSDSKLATLAKGVVVDGLLRYDLPTSEASQAAGSYGEGWAGAGISKSVGIVDFKYTELVRYYFQSRDTSNVTSIKGVRSLNRENRIYSFADIGVNITKKLSLNFEGGFMNQYSREDSQTGRDRVLNDFIIVNPDIGYAFSDSFALNAGIWETPDMRDMKSAYRPLSADAQNQGEGYVLSTVKF
jgi:hypothetical protein